MMVNEMSIVIYRKGGDSGRIISRKQVSPCPVVESLLTQKSMEIVKRFVQIVKRSIHNIKAKKGELARCQPYLRRE